MRTKLLVLTIVISIALIGCGSTKSNTEEVIENNTEVEENETLFEVELDLTDNTTFNSKWTKDSNDKIYVSHVIQSEDVNELAACCALSIDYLSQYDNNNNITYSIQGFSLNPDNISPYIQVSSVLGITATEDDGTMVNDIPQWLANANIESIDIHSANIIVKSLKSLFEKETSIAEKYIK